MTGSNIFPKVDGDVLYASDVNSIFRKSIKAGIAGIAYGQKGIANLGFTRAATDYQAGEFNVDGFASTLTSETGSSTALIDNYGNPSWTSPMPTIRHIAAIAKRFTSGNWTTSITGGASISYDDSTNIVTLAAPVGTTASVTSMGVTGINFKNIPGSDSEVYFRITNIAGTSNPYTEVSISSSGTDTVLKNVTGMESNTFRLAFSKSLGKVFKSEMDGSFDSGTDISALGSWFLKLNAVGAGGAGVTSTITPIGYVTGAGSVSILSSTNILNTNCSGGFLTWDSDASDSDISGFLSLDAGSNYTSATKDTWANITNTGSASKIKLWCNFPSSINGNGTIKNIKTVRYMGAYFE